MSCNIYAEAINEYMKHYDENKELSYLVYLDVNNLYGWAMSQILPANGFKWKKAASKIDEDFIKNYNEDSNNGYTPEVDVECPEDLHDLHSDLRFLPE